MTSRIALATPETVALAKSGKDPKVVWVDTKKINSKKARLGAKKLDQHLREMGLRK